MDDGFYTIKEFARVLQVHPNTIYRAIKFGRIQAFRVGTGKKAHWRIYRHEVQRMAEFDLRDTLERITNQQVGVNSCGT